MHYSLSIYMLLLSLLSSLQSQGSLAQFLESCWMIQPSWGCFGGVLILLAMLIFLVTLSQTIILSTAGTFPHSSIILSKFFRQQCAGWIEDNIFNLKVRINQILGFLHTEILHIAIFRNLQISESGRKEVTVFSIFC